MKKNSSGLTYEPGKKIEVKNPSPEYWRFVRREQLWHWCYRLVKLIIIGTGILFSGIYRSKIKEVLEQIVDLFE